MIDEGAKIGAKCTIWHFSHIMSGASLGDSCNIGQNVMVNDRHIIGIFDLDITSQSPQTRRFLDQAEKDSVVLPVCDDIPKSFLVCDHPYHRQIVYISQLNTQTLVKRAEKK